MNDRRVNAERRIVIGDRRNKDTDLRVAFDEILVSTNANKYKETCIHGYEFRINSCPACNSTKNGMRAVIRRFRLTESE